MSRLKKYLNEAITLDIEIGDTILGGKWKNKRVKVKTITYNERNEPLVNGKPLMKYRLIPKQEEEEPEEKVEVKPEKTGWETK